jgi:hypothetical protein
MISRSLKPVRDGAFEGQKGRAGRRSIAAWVRHGSDTGRIIGFPIRRSPREGKVLGFIRLAV